MASDIALSQAAAAETKRRRNYARHYAWFVVPAAVVVIAVIIFPWVFTLYVSAFNWHLGGEREWVGFGNYVKLFTDSRFGWAVARTLFYTGLAVVLPMIFGLAAALAFHRKFPLRGLARTVFILPMMATPVAVALVWTMMFHPQLGVLNWLLSQVGLPPSLWVYSAETVIPTLVLVEVWHWTPLVMLLILGGLASLPTDPYEAAKIDGANAWQAFRHITMPLLAPFVVVALIIRTIDALKAFDTIYVITQGGPGQASETINIFLYLQAFAFYNVGYASAVVVVFFAIIMLLAALLLWTRQRVKAT
ncbi:carbohydrate ABC transporter permease [Neoroseomonas oryzicola]|uniref:Sugar ABC transporter permease n=1 Tax=Neoroseomonas oryzicola TaxID=535904 RepID=A0A9X9WM11_9PROT|nr:sugar ABC transporter permease [Neoroseomonas oryzicola]MBR0661371.1 sugar ABC transporter permease [Neoroseomonas oryzicola]NKE17462.1 sugar ABC transporter permease [Neoroseomonas oryzicola]